MDTSITISGSKTVEIRDVGCKGIGWNVCVLYANGKERVLWSFRNREVALRSIDALYGYGYPLHVAYVLRQTHRPTPQSHTHPILDQLRQNMKMDYQAAAWYS